MKALILAVLLCVPAVADHHDSCPAEGCKCECTVELKDKLVVLGTLCPESHPVSQGHGVNANRQVVSVCRKLFHEHKCECKH